MKNKFVLILTFLFVTVFGFISCSSDKCEQPQSPNGTVWKLVELLICKSDDWENADIIDCSDKNCILYFMSKVTLNICNNVLTDFSADFKEDGTYCYDYTDINYDSDCMPPPYQFFIYTKLPLVLDDSHILTGNFFPHNIQESEELHLYTVSLTEDGGSIAMSMCKRFIRMKYDGDK